MSQAFFPFVIKQRINNKTFHRGQNTRKKISGPMILFPCLLSKTETSLRKSRAYGTIYLRHYIFIYLFPFPAVKLSEG